MTVFLQDPDVTVYHGDALDVLRGLPDGSVHACVTSPPYWGLRDYGQDGQLGLEPTPEEYVTRLVEIFAEVRRVLRHDGTCWLNLGDSYNAYNGNRGTDSEYAGKRREKGEPEFPRGRGLMTPALKPKDLVGIPWRVAFALQADGWYLRSDIIWSKPNPMPESVTDRPTKAHEYVFLLSKSPRYFFDQEAVRDPHSSDALERTQNPRHGFGSGEGNGAHRTMHALGAHPAGRNVRSVWEIATKPYADAHFAVFPPELARRCILAGTSERGVCPECGAPWERIVDLGTDPRAVPLAERAEHGATQPGNATIKGGTFGSGRPREVKGWRPTCEHDRAPVPATVLDPFLGSGTTAHVARQHGRHAIGVELNPDYCQLAADRLAQQSLLAQEVA